MEVTCTDKSMDGLKRVLLRTDSNFVVKNIKARLPLIKKPSVEYNNETTDSEVIWFPMSIWDLDKCHHLHTSYQPDMDSRHPGFSDKAYRARRDHIVQVAFSFRQGDAIPRVEYTPDEVQTWG